MGRRENFKAILNHQTPDDLILDLGGCPLSTMQGMSMYTLLDHLGFPYEPPKGGVLPWGQVVRLDERLLEALDIDTARRRRRAGAQALAVPQSVAHALHRRIRD